MDPTARMLARQASGDELIHTDMGAGRTFTLYTGPSGLGGEIPYEPVTGQIAWGPRRLTYDLQETLDDGAVITQDRDLASALAALPLWVS